VNLEDICNGVTVKILRYLLKEGQVNITRMSRELGIHHRVIRKHMEKLRKAGIVEERRYERLHIYIINLRNPKVAALKELLEELENIIESL
jgi:DNA-binding transcriptional ArsR family regulator